MNIDTEDLEQTLVPKIKAMTRGERILEFVRAKVLLDKFETQPEDPQAMEALATVRILERPDHFLDGPVGP
ncbi:MAG: hypothetical protein WBK55_04410 [Alphaproteobacteria bacterium]